MFSSTVQTVPEVGSKAPEFSLQCTNGETVSLASFEGKQAVLLAFFPLAFTSVCTTEVCAFSDDYDKFAEASVVVLPTSVDSIPTLKEFKAKHGIKTDFLSDFKREAGNAYGVMFQDTFFTNRAYFLIDKDGIIRWAHVEEAPGQRREESEIFAEIAKL